MIFENVRKQNVKLWQICCFLFLMLFLFPTLSWAAEYGTVTGHVYDDNGTALNGVGVYFTTAAGADCSSWPSPVTTPSITTDALGYYNSLDLPVGTYYVNANPDNTGSAPWYTQDWYDGANGVLYNSCDYSVNPGVLQATTITVTAGNVTSGIDFTLARAGIVSGTITGEGGVQTTGMCINFYDACGGNLIWTGGTAASGNSNQTYNTTADYEVLVPIGTYYVKSGASCAAASSSLLDEYYSSTTDNVHYSCTGASAVTVTDGGTAADIDFALIVGNGIGGTAYIDNSSTTIGGLEVALYNITGGKCQTDSIWTTTTDTATGSWYIKVPPGTYYAISGQNYAVASNSLYYYPEWYTGPLPADTTGTTVCTSANSIDASVDVGGIDFHLSQGALISGTVTDKYYGTPISGVCVEADTTSCQTTVPTDTATTDSDGKYSMVVEPGTYYVNTNTTACGTQAAYDEWWSGSSSDDTTDCASATAVTVLAGSTTTIDYGLVQTAAAPAPTPDVTVEVMNVNLISSGPFYVGSVIKIASVFSGVVKVKGKPYLVLNMGGVPVKAYYSSGHGTKTLIFQYTVVTGDDISKLGYWSQWSIGGESDDDKIYSDDDDININLDTPAPGELGSLSYNMTLGVLSTVYPMYRFYSAVLLRHLFTADENEKNHLLANAADIWTLEKSTYKVFLPHQYNAATQEEKNTLMAVNRFYNAGLQTHHYTVDTNEIAHLIAQAADIWQNDGAVFYVPVGNPEGAIPVYRLYSETLKVHHYTVDENEKESLEATDLWRYEGISFYAYPPS